MASVDCVLLILGGNHLKARTQRPAIGDFSLAVCVICSPNGLSSAYGIAKKNRAQGNGRDSLNIVPSGGCLMHFNWKFLGRNDRRFAASYGRKPQTSPAEFKAALKHYGFRVVRAKIEDATCNVQGSWSAVLRGHIAIDYRRPYRRDRKRQSRIEPSLPRLR
jgi:hypothetical protein